MQLHRTRLCLRGRPKACVRVRAVLSRPAPSGVSTDRSDVDRVAEAGTAAPPQHNVDILRRPPDILSQRVKGSSLRRVLPSRPPLTSSKQVVAFVLGGGPGTDLWPLTATRAEPAVHLGAHCRLVDVPVSNCVNSGVHQVYVLAQYNATSLQRHVAKAYNFLTGAYTGGFVEVLNATQRLGSTDAGAWYAGTADAVRKFLHLLEDDFRHESCEDVLVMCGDQLYRMDFQALINQHRASGADITIAATPTDEAGAARLGVLQLDDDMNVVAFAEKPAPQLLPRLSTDTGACFGLEAEQAAAQPFAASMGIYCIKKDVLMRMLRQDCIGGNDFARDILPRALVSHAVKAFPHTSYWRDVGTLSSFYEASLQLAHDDSQLRLWDLDRPVYSEARMLPPNKLYCCSIASSLLGEGCRISESRLSNSVIGSGTYIDAGCTIEDSIIFGADTYDTQAMRQQELAAGLTPLGIGTNCMLRRVIVDRNARVGAGCQLVNREGVAEMQREELGVCIREGIVCVMDDAVVPPGTVI